MYHSKERVITFIMILIFSLCTVSINNYSTLYMVHSIQLAFLYYRIVIIFKLDNFTPSNFKVTAHSNNRNSKSSREVILGGVR